MGRLGAKSDNIKIKLTKFSITTPPIDSAYKSYGLCYSCCPAKFGNDLARGHCDHYPAIDFVY